MTGDGRETDRERLGQLEHGCLTVGQPTHDRAPRRVRQGGEDDVEPIGGRHGHRCRRSCRYFTDWLFNRVTTYCQGPLERTAGRGLNDTPTHTGPYDRRHESLLHRWAVVRRVGMRSVISSSRGTGWSTATSCRSVTQVSADLRIDLTDAGQVFNALSAYAGFDELEPGTGVPRYDAVVHFAAIPAILVRPDNETFRINVLSTYNVIDAAVKLGIRKVIFASSETTYGICFADGEVKPEYVPVDEEHPTVPHDSYAMSKVVNEVDGTVVPGTDRYRHLRVAHQQRDRTARVRDQVPGVRRRSRPAASQHLRLHRCPRPRPHGRLLPAHRRPRLRGLQRRRTTTRR